jgi:hypothetical protein
MNVFFSAALSLNQRQFCGETGQQLITKMINFFSIFN